MRQVHLAGERQFVDFAGQTAEVIGPATSEVGTAGLSLDDVQPIKMLPSALPKMLPTRMRRQ
jgi:hypothetical protein